MPSLVDPKLRLVQPKKRRKAGGWNNPVPDRDRLRDLTAERWLQILEVYRKHDGATQKIAAELGWPRARVSRAYRNGNLKLGFRPFRELLAEDAAAIESIRAERMRMDAKLPPPAHVTTVEQVMQKPEVIHAAEALRMKKMMKREEDADRAREDSIKTKAEEALLISIGRRNALAMNGVTSQILKGAMVLSGTVQSELEAAAANTSMTTKEKLELVRYAANIARFNSEISALALKSERLALGQPIDSGPSKIVEAGTIDDSVQWLNTVSKAIQRAKDRGILVASNPTTKDDD